MMISTRLLSVRQIALVGLLGWGSTLQADTVLEYPGQLRGCSGGYCEIQGRLESSALLQGRLELEVRRLGGPRKPVIEALLLKGRWEKPVVWLDLALPMAAQNLLAARALDRTAEGCLERVSGRTREEVEVAVARFLANTALNRMTSTERGKVYSEAIVRGIAPVGSHFIDRLNAIDRVANEDCFELFPAVRAWYAGAELEDGPALAMLESAEAVRDLGCSERSVELLLAPGGRGSDAGRFSGVRASEIAKRLRRRSCGNLKTAMRLSLMVGAHLQPGKVPAGAVARTRDDPRSEGRSPQSRAYVVAAELLGDMGDRDAERELLRGKTLFDVVSRAERRLIVAGTLDSRERVAEAPVRE